MEFWASQRGTSPVSLEVSKPNQETRRSHDANSTPTVSRRSATPVATRPPDPRRRSSRPLPRHPQGGSRALGSSGRRGRRVCPVDRRPDRSALPGRERSVFVRPPVRERGAEGRRGCPARLGGNPPSDAGHVRVPADYLVPGVAGPGGGRETQCLHLGRTYVEGAAAPEGTLGLRQADRGLPLAGGPPSAADPGTARTAAECGPSRARPLRGRDRHPLEPADRSGLDASGSTEAGADSREEPEGLHRGSLRSENRSTRLRRWRPGRLSGCSSTCSARSWWSTVRSVGST
jgi:hypothetical protein